MCLLLFYVHYFKYLLQIKGMLPSMWSVCLLTTSALPLVAAALILGFD